MRRHDTAHSAGSGSYPKGFAVQGIAGGDSLDADSYCWTHLGSGRLKGSYIQRAELPGAGWIRRGFWGW